MVVLLPQGIIRLSRTAEAQVTSPAAIAICPAVETPQLRARAQTLARELGLPLTTIEPGATGRSRGARPAGTPDRAQYDLLLMVGQDRLEVRQAARGGSGPVSADFVGGWLARRRRSPACGAAMLARAVGLKHTPPAVCDATAGLARDAFLLAVAGCAVTAIERSVVMAALVRDGLERAMADPDLAPIVRDRFRLIVGDARWIMAGWPAPERPDVVYLDPMFPWRPKSALAKKEMRICRLVAGDDPDGGELLEVALSVARSRVVVKRPVHAPPLRPDPSFAYKGRTVRYDIYLPVA
jgi:16S rRNA (guanine1516-N2)-methyltransferase